MKKIIVIVLVLIVSLFVMKKINADTLIVIPDSAIRLRVIANSNTAYDQHMKKLVKENLETSIFTLLKDTTDIEEARKIVSANLNKMEDDVKNIFLENDYKETFKFDFGLNYFPEKEFKGIKYKAGEYESLALTIGSGEGDNWWCVLFPPLCMMETTDKSEVEYKFWAKEWIDKIFKN